MQKLEALAYRFYQFGIWTPKPGDLYTTTRADLELYEIVEIRDGSVFTRYRDTDKSEVISEWLEEEFLSPETFGRARVWVPHWIMNAP